MKTLAWTSRTTTACFSSGSSRTSRSFTNALISTPSRTCRGGASSASRTASRSTLLTTPHTWWNSQPQRTETTLPRSFSKCVESIAKTWDSTTLLTLRKLSKRGNLLTDGANGEFQISNTSCRLIIMVGAHRMICHSIRCYHGSSKIISRKTLVKRWTMKPSTSTTLEVSHLPKFSEIYPKICSC